MGRKIILSGASLNSGNKGVNALTRGQVMLIYDMYGIDTEIVILSYTVKNLVNNTVIYDGKKMEIKEIPCTIKKLVKTYICSKFSEQGELLREIKSANAVWDISEGDSFSDIYGIKRFIKHSLVKLTAISVKTKLVIMPQTLGPFKRKWVKLVAKYILNKANNVFVRDEISKKVVIENLSIKRDIKYIPDMAFYMKPDNNISIEKFINDFNNIKIGVNVSALLYNGGYTGNNMFNLKLNYKNLIDNLIQTFAKMDGIDIILIPHVMTTELEVEDDFRVCKKIADNISKSINIKINTIDKFYREDEIKAIISGCDFFIGSRMHACIGAISTMVPTAPIAYSRKFIGIWDKLDLGNCVTDPRNQSEYEIIKSILNTFNNREEIKSILNKKIPLLKKQIQQIIDIIEN